MKAKETKNTRVSVLGLIVVISTLVLMLAMTIVLSLTCGKILYAQARIIQYRGNISSAEASRDYYRDEHRLYPMAGYYAVSDEFDAEVGRLTDECNEFKNNITDPVMKWALRYDRDFATIVAGLSGFVFIVVSWVLLNTFSHQIFMSEYRFFRFVLFWTAHAGTLLFSALYNLCVRAEKANRSGKHFRTKKCRKVRGKSNDAVVGYTMRG